MEQNLTVALRSMEERIAKVKQYVATLEDENAELRLQLNMLEESIEKQDKGEGSVLAKKNMQLNDLVRKYRKEREFLSEKITGIIEDVREMKRNVD